MRWLRTRWCQSPSAARGEPLREEDVILELIVPRCLPVAPRPVAGELLSSWIERIAAANAITGAELLKSVTDCLSMERQHALLDYCLAPTLRCALAIAGRVSDLDVQALELGNQFRNLQPEWVLPGAKVVLISVAKPGICTECIAEQHIAGEVGEQRKTLVGASPTCTDALTGRVGFGRRHISEQLRILNDAERSAADVDHWHKHRLSEHQRHGNDVELSACDGRRHAAIRWLDPGPEGALVHGKWRRHGRRHGRRRDG